MQGAVIFPYLWRRLYVLLSIFSAGFPGILMYLLLWWIMPSEVEASRFDLEDYRVR
ncbi:MAG: PspC domain-containing protein [bacterium]